MTAALRVIDPGLQSTLQDMGRHGHQRLGIPVSGALDWVCLRAANLLVGNPAAMAAIEIALVGPTLEVDADSVRVALTGTAAGIEILAPERVRVPSLQSVVLQRGQRFRIAGFGDAAAAYLAIEGGFAIAPVMGSLSTHWRAQIGPLEGRKLAAGDRLPLEIGRAPERDEVRLRTLGLVRPERFRVVLGPQDDKFTPEQVRTLLDGPFRVSRDADRWGMRLDGPVLAHTISIVSDAIAPGSIQVPAGGQPLVLLADRATTGGYPKIATVISADLPALGRSTPGMPVAFAAVSVEQAEAARRTLEAQVLALDGQLEPVRSSAGLDAALLSSENLISGVVDGDRA
jgi:biotin-dependent carboxylase-like uncharacterized protein